MTVPVRVCRLQEVAVLNPSLDVSPADDEAVSFLPMSAVDADAVDAIDTETRPFREVSKGYTPFMADDVLVAKITPCFENGKIAQAKPTRRFGFASTEFHVIRTHRFELDPRYLVHYLRQERIRKEGERKMTGSAGQRRVPVHFLANLNVPLPPLPEQRRIAEILDKADELRAKRRAALKKLDELAQSIFLDMFGDPATNPKGWPIKQLGDVATEVYRYPTYYDIEYVVDGVPEVRGELLNADGSIATDRARLRFISPQTSARFPKTVLAAGDLIMTVRGTIGKIGLVPPDLAGANITANLIRIAFDHNRLDPVFAWHSTQTSSFKAQLLAACSSTTILTIKAPDLRRIRIALPPIDLQRKFAERVKVLKTVEASQTTSQRALDALFASLQHRAFRGGL
jgi:type I restriction enzyme S subunit